MKACVESRQLLAPLIVWPDLSGDRLKRIAFEGAPPHPEDRAPGIAAGR
ncbi:MAG: hypothetical protein QNJ35_05310 [Paracoccaceae bacterium]|nr:hypothetical protein [Paracoccaceae bacterium]